MRFREKVEALLALQVDIVLCLQFNQRLRELSGREFIEPLSLTGCMPGIWWWATISASAMTAQGIFTCCRRWVRRWVSR